MRQEFVILSDRFNFYSIVILMTTADIKGEKKGRKSNYLRYADETVRTLDSKYLLWSRVITKGEAMVFITVLRELNVWLCTRNKTFHRQKNFDQTRREL